MFFQNQENQVPASGDTTAFDRFYATYAPRVLAYLVRLTGGCRTEAEDLTQETFLAAYSARTEFVGSSPLAWLMGIARRRQRDAFRAQSIRPRTETLELAENATTSGNMDETTLRRIALENALNRLDPDERDAILLVVVQGLTYSEASKITEEPIGTVKWRVHTGTKRLRHLLSSAFAEEYSTEISRKEPASHVNPELKTVANSR